MAKKDFSGIDALFSGGKKNSEAVSNIVQPPKKIKKTTFDIEQDFFLSFKSWASLNQIHMQDFIIDIIEEVLKDEEIKDKTNIERIVYTKDDTIFKKTFDIEDDKLNLFKSILSKENVKMKNFLIYHMQKAMNTKIK